MSALLERLPGRAQRGSKPRCHFMMHGSRDAVARLLAALTNPFATVAPLFPSDVWDRSWMLNGQPFIPLIRSSHQALSERGES